MAQGWTQLSNTTLSSICATLPYSPQGTNGCRAIIESWSTGVIDTKRNRMLLWGGGHTDYYGNEVYSLNMSPATPTLTQITTPTDAALNPGFPATCPDANTADGSPVARHTYSGLVYLPGPDRMYSFGGAPAPCGGPFSRKTYTLDLSVTPPVWHAMDPVSGYNPTTENVNLGMWCAYNPNDSLVWCIQGDLYNLITYNYATNTYTRKTTSSTTIIGNATQIVLDPDRQKLYFIGTQLSDNTLFKFASIDISSGSSYAVTDLSSLVTGCSALKVEYPGLTYDTARGTIVGYPGSGNTVYEFHPDTLTCTAQSFSGTLPSAVVSELGHFNYFPALGKYVALNNGTHNAYQLVLDATPTNGLGSSTFTCVDRDGDGYGTGPGCSGRDADDLDASVHTGSQFVTKWSTLSAGLTHLGYTPTRIWYIATNGNDGTCVSASSPVGIGSPCLTFSPISSNLLAGDMVIYRSGTYTETSRFTPSISGSPGAPIIAMAYPGESAIIDTTATFQSDIDLIDLSYIVIDGLRLVNGRNNGCISGGSQGLSTITFHNNTFRHVEASACLWGLSGIGLSNVLIEDCVFHDEQASGGQHGVYIGARGQQTSNNNIVRRNLFYNNGYTGIQVNGSVANLVQDQNISYGNLIADYSWENGVHNSFFRSNLAMSWGGSGGLVISEYNGNEGLAACGVSGTDVCVCSPPNLAAICAHDQTGNLIENFTAYGTVNDSNGSSAQNSAAILVALQNRSTSCTTATCLGANLGSNTFRNVIAVNNTDGSNHYMPIVYPDSDKTYLSTSTFSNIVSYQNDSGHGSNVFGFGADVSFGWSGYTCSTAAALTTLSGCTNSNPLFVAANPAWWNAISSFDFSLQSASPARATGTLVGIPSFDLEGNIFNSSPSMGSLETFPSCELTPSSLPNGVVGTPYSQTITSTLCGSSTFTISSGSLTACTGLSINSGTGIISGTPSLATTCTFTVAYDTATDPLSITILGSAIGTGRGGNQRGGGPRAKK